MGKRWATIAVSAWLMCLGACKSVPFHDFQDEISGLGEIQITGWAKLRGEFLIYSDAGSMKRQLRYPHCISGVFANQAEIMKSLSAYDGRLVVLTGELFNYADLSDEERPILPRKMLSDSVVLNACLGPKVMLIKTMNLASGAK